MSDAGIESVKNLEACDNPSECGKARRYYENLARLRADQLNRALEQQLGALQEIRESEKQFRTLVEHAPDAILIYDVDDDRFVEANSRAVTLFSVSRDNLLKLGLADVTAPNQEDGGKTFTQFNQEALGGHVPVFQWTLRDSAGKDLPCEIRLVRLPSKDRRLIRCSVMDIGDRLKVEQQFRQAQKMDAVGRLAGGVAHDFNNLLTAIISFAGFALDSLAEADPARADVQEVLKAAGRAEDLTRQLLSFSRQRTIAPRVLNANSLIGSLEKMLCRLLGEDIELSSHVAPDLCNVEIDPGAFEQVIVNLAINARDAMASGGRLTLQTTNVELEESTSSFCGAAVPAGQYAVVSVSDEGVGMEREVLQRIFEPFFTTKPEGRGTGLGLSTCYGIIKQANGFIWAFSEPGQGTTVKVYLPQAAKEADERATKEEAAPGTGSETVLVVEDDDQVRALAVRSLRKYGYQALEAANGGEALLIAESAHAPIDVVLTDVIMPRMNGQILAARLLAACPTMKVLYMSGYAERSVANQGVVPEGTHLLQKPFTPDLLVRRVRDLLDGREKGV